MGRPLSEQHFELFCSARGLTLERIAEAATRTPDYELVLGDTRVVVEV
jgi:hypothetical protein